MASAHQIGYTGERYVPGVGGQIRYEHLHRYAIARRLAVDARVLDVASGEGYGASLLATVASEVVGVDIDERAIARARSVYFAPNLRFVVGSASALPLMDASFDVVSSFETIERLAEHERMIDEIKRVLALGGTLIISSPNKLVYSDIPQYANPFHVRELYFSEFRELLAQRFRHVALFGQRISAVSVVHPLASAGIERPLWYAGHHDEIRDALPSLKDPMYFIAVASDEPLDLEVESAFLDPLDDVFEDIAQEMRALRARVLQSSSPDLPELPGAARAAIAGDAAATYDGALEIRAVDHHRVREFDERTRVADAGARDVYERLPEADEQRLYQLSRYDELAALYNKERAERELEISILRERVRELDQSTEEAEKRARAAEAQAATVSAELERVGADCKTRIGEAEREVLGWADRARRAERELSRNAKSTTIADDAISLAREDAFALGRALGLIAGSAEVDPLRSRIAALEQERIDADVALRQEMARVVAAANEVHACAERDSLALQEIVRSKSWRLTQPLRQLVAPFRTRER